jgi:hypothetical protein
MPPGFAESSHTGGERPRRLCQSVRISRRRRSVLARFSLHTGLLGLIGEQSASLRRKRYDALHLAKASAAAKSAFIESSFLKIRTTKFEEIL